ncbi:hypothetical protein CRYUN_Cryun01aG0080900 [Craigia yunnanensis]
MAEQLNGATVDENHCSHTEETLYGVLHRLISIIFTDASLSASLRCCSGSRSLFQRMGLVSAKPPETLPGLFCCGLVEAAPFVLFSSFL